MDGSADIWLYNNVSVKQGDTDGELMFDFQLNELGRDADEEEKVRTDLTTIFRHNLSSGKLELVFLTLQEFQFLTINYGKFFKNKNWKQDPDDVSMPKPRFKVYQHFCGISAGISALDSQNAVRVSNMLPSFNGSRIAIRRAGVYGRSVLYFKKTVKKDDNGDFIYRDIAVGDALFLLKHNKLARDSEMTVELRNADPAILFTVENNTLALKRHAKAKAVYYYFATVSAAEAVELRQTKSSYPIGYVAGVHKTNFHTPTPSVAGEDKMYYHLVRSPAMQRSDYLVDLTFAGREVARHLLPGVSMLSTPNPTGGALLIIGAAAPTPGQENVPLISSSAVASEKNSSTASMKRTAEDAKLSVSAQSPLPKINRKSGPSSTPPINPAT